MSDTDPAVERLDDALSRTRELEQRASRGEVIAPAELASELRAVRDDLLAERRDVLNKRQEFEARFADLDARKLNRNRGAFVALNLLGAGLVTFGFGYTLWLITGGSS